MNFILSQAKLKFGRKVRENRNYNISITLELIHFSCRHCFVEAIIKMASCDVLKKYKWARRTAARGDGLETATVCYILCLFGQGNFIVIREKSGNFAL